MSQLSQSLFDLSGHHKFKKYNVNSIRDDSFHQCISWRRQMALIFVQKLTEWSREWGSSSRLHGSDAAPELNGTLAGSPLHMLHLSLYKRGSETMKATEVYTDIHTKTNPSPFSLGSHMPHMQLSFLHIAFLSWINSLLLNPTETAIQQK